MFAADRRTRLLATLGLVALLAAGCAQYLGELSRPDPLAAATPEDGLREALRVGTQRAVAGLARTDGYLGDADVRIPIPRKLDDLADALRLVGAGDRVDEFVTSMNRAAEAAAPLAERVFVDAIREMSFADAVTILRGSRHEATDYLREHAGPRLGQLFRPIVGEQLDAVGATRSFNRLMAETGKLPFVDRPVFDLGDYVTETALAGLFRKVGEEELRIRTDPVARTTALLRKFFGQPAQP